MADHQKIHPAVDLEAPPTPSAPPLVPHGHQPSSTTPQKMNLKGPSTAPADQQQPASAIPQEMNKKGPSTSSPADQQRRLPSGPRSAEVARTIPVIPAGAKQPEKRRLSSTCCRCICWVLSILLLVVILIGATIGILYLIFHPKLPTYSVDSLKISDLRLNFDMSLYAKFDVKITAQNPNKKIGIYYEKGGRMSVWYTKMQLCEGGLPKFYQGHRNKTVLNVALTGQNQYGSALMSALQQQQQTGSIPLDLKVNAPVAIELGTMKLRKVKILGKCVLIVDSLSTNNLISIKANSCKFGLKL